MMVALVVRPARGGARWSDGRARRYASAAPRMFGMGWRRSARATERSVRGAGQVSHGARARAPDGRLPLPPLAVRGPPGRGTSQARAGLDLQHVTFGCT